MPQNADVAGRADDIMVGSPSDSDLFRLVADEFDPIGGIALVDLVPHDLAFYGPKRSIPDHAKSCLPVIPMRQRCRGEVLERSQKRSHCINERLPRVLEIC